MASARQVAAGRGRRAGGSAVAWHRRPSPMMGGQPEQEEEARERQRQSQSKLICADRWAGLSVGALAEKGGHPRRAAWGGLSKLKEEKRPTWGSSVRHPGGVSRHQSHLKGHG